MNAYLRTSDRNQEGSLQAIFNTRLFVFLAIDETLFCILWPKPLF